MSSKGKDLMDTIHLVLSFPRSLILCIMFDYGSLYTCSNLWQEEAFLVLAEPGTNLWTEYNATRTHFITLVFICLFLLLFICVFIYLYVAMSIWSLVYLASDSCLTKQWQVWVPSCEVGLLWICCLLLTPTSFVRPFPKHMMQDLWLTWFLPFSFGSIQNTFLYQPWANIEMASLCRPLLTT